MSDVFERRRTERRLAWGDIPDVPHCEMLDRCRFYAGEVEIGTGAGSVYKLGYCQGGWRDCARYRVAQVSGEENVPSDLYPHMCHRADEILSEAPTADAD